MSTLSTGTRPGSILLTMALLLLGGPPAFGRADEKQNEADQRMLKTLEEIRFRQAEMKDGRFDLDGAAAAYAKAFRDCGIEPVGQKAEEAAKLIRARSIRVALAVALDDWAFVTRDAGKREWLREVARQADPDPWRNRLRDALRADVKALRKLATDEAVQKQSPTTLVMLGRGLERAGAVNEAVELLRVAQKLHPADFWINFTLANLYSQLSPPRPDEAVAFYRAALALRPRSPAIHLNMGAALAGQGRLDEAIACYRKALDLDPKAARAHAELGNALRAKGQLPEALDRYRAAIALDPQLSYVHRELGSTLYQMGRVPEAVAAFQRALALDPRDVQTLLGMGDLLMAQGKMDEAIAIFRKVIALDPQRAVAHLKLGHAFRATGKLDEALACYRGALELQPDFAEALNALGTVLTRQGKVGEATAAFRQAIRRKPDFPEAHANLGLALRAQGKLDEALNPLREAIRLKPDFVQAYIDLGFALQERGYFAEACAMLKRGLQLLPEKDARRARVHKAFEECERLRDKK